VGEHDYFARICVILFERVDLPDEPVPSLVATESALIPIPFESGPAVGYYREIGFRCQPGDIVDVVEFAADDGEIHWGRSEWHETKFESLPRHVRQRVYLDHEAVWYRGEREYFRRW
jgi:hypothetical protein